MRCVKCDIFSSNEFRNPNEIRSFHVLQFVRVKLLTTFILKSRYQTGYVLQSREMAMVWCFKCFQFLQMEQDALYGFAH